MAPVIAPPYRMWDAHPWPNCTSPGKQDRIGLLISIQT